MPDAFLYFRAMVRHCLLLSWLIFTVMVFPAAEIKAADKPLRVLLIAGGCCHDYGKQKDILKNGLESRAHVQIDVVYSSDTTTRARFDIYEKPTWADGYDAVIHDECSADIKEPAYVRNILAAHEK